MSLNQFFSGVMRGAVLASCLSFLFASETFAQESRGMSGEDPTRPQGRLAETLRERVANLGKLRIRALVVGSENNGVALVGSDNFI